jgi:DNA-directed RNA polymerase specialized sigma24 family protein
MWWVDGTVGQAQRGDPEAFRVLYRDIQPRLLRYLHSLVGQALTGERRTRGIRPPAS